MITVLKPEIIDVEGGSTHIQQYAPNVDREVIKNLLNEIAKIKDRKTHVIVKDLQTSKTAVEKKKDEPTK